jgi:hypothetical protein
MEHQEDVLDLVGFLKLLGEVMPRYGTGVLSTRIHVRDGMPWAVSVQFHNAEKKAARPPGGLRPSSSDKQFKRTDVRQAGFRGFRGL